MRLLYLIFVMLCGVLLGEVQESKLHEMHETKPSGRSMRRALKQWDWGPATEREIKTHRIKTLLFVFHDKTNPTQMKSAKEAIDAAAYEFAKKDILHIFVEREHTQTFQFFLKDEEDSDFPFAVIVEVDKGFRKYRLNTPVTATALKSFEQMYFAQQLKPWLRSEEEVVVDYPDHEVVYPLAGTAFNKRVMENKNDVLVFFLLLGVAIVRNLSLDSRIWLGFFPTYPPLSS
eukprot:Platyproteum_vivax@DN3819_c0_g1_i1.p1